MARMHIGQSGVGVQDPIVGQRDVDAGPSVLRVPQGDKEGGETLDRLVARNR